MVRKLALFLFWTLIVAHQIWREVELFFAFQANEPGAGVWAFFADRSLIHLLNILVAMAVLALLWWIDRSLPDVDADNTEFHEREVTDYGTR